MEITVYTRPDCQQCDATFRALATHGLDYTTVDITEDPGARELVTGLGYLQAPVVVAGDQHWSGFRPDRVEALPLPAAEEPAPAVEHEDAKVVRIGGLIIPAYERPDVEAVERWAAPFLRSASKLGDIPKVGSAAWVALPGNDPRKTGAVVQAALDQARSVADLEDRVRLDIEHMGRARRLAEKDASLDVGEAMRDLNIRPGPSHEELQRIRYGDRAEEVTRQQARGSKARVDRPPAWRAAQGPLTEPAQSRPAPPVATPGMRSAAVPSQTHAHISGKGMVR